MCGVLYVGGGDVGVGVVGDVVVRVVVNCVDQTKWSKQVLHVKFTKYCG